MKKYIFLIVFCLGSVPLLASMPIMHVHLANEWIAQCTDYSEEEERQFILGTLLPDISCDIKGEKLNVHEYGVQLEDVATCEDPFLAGLKLHCFIDEFRKPILEKADLFTLLTDVSRPSTLIKVIEEEHVYDTIEIGKLLGQLRSIKADDQKLEVPAEVMVEWYRQLARYCSERPFEHLLLVQQTHRPILNLTLDHAGEWEQCIPKYLNHERFTSYTSDYLNSFDEAITPYKR